MWYRQYNDVLMFMLLTMILFLKGWMFIIQTLCHSSAALYIISYHIIPYHIIIWCHTMLRYLTFNSYSIHMTPTVHNTLIHVHTHMDDIEMWWMTHRDMREREESWYVYDNVDVYDIGSNVCFDVWYDNDVGICKGE